MRETYVCFKLIFFIKVIEYFECLGTRFPIKFVLPVVLVIDQIAYLALECVTWVWRASWGFLSRMLGTGKLPNRMLTTHTVVILRLRINSLLVLLAWHIVLLRFVLVYIACVFGFWLHGCDWCEMRFRRCWPILVVLLRLFQLLKRFLFLLIFQLIELKIKY